MSGAGIAIFGTSSVPTAYGMSCSQSQCDDVRHYSDRRRRDANYQNLEPSVHRFRLLPIPSWAQMRDSRQMAAPLPAIWGRGLRTVSPELEECLDAGSWCPAVEHRQSRVGLSILPPADAPGHDPGANPVDGRRIFNPLRCTES